MMNTVYYERPGSDNTEETLRLAIQIAKENNMTLLVATSSGSNFLKAVKEADNQDYKGTIAAVTHAYGLKDPGMNEFPESLRTRDFGRKVVFITAAHALSGAERGISSKYSGMYPVEIIAQTLRMFGNGMKVCVEISMMAADAGAVSPMESVVAVGGTKQGADTACIITPSYSASVFSTRIHEIICKPKL